MKTLAPDFIFHAFVTVMLVITAVLTHQIREAAQQAATSIRRVTPATSTLGGNQNALAAPLRDGAGLWRAGLDAGSASTRHSIDAALQATKNLPTAVQ